MTLPFDLAKLSENYGDVFTISLFGETMVAVNSTEIIMELLKNTPNGDQFIDKPVATYVSKVKE